MSDFNVPEELVPDYAMSKDMQVWLTQSLYKSSQRLLAYLDLSPEEKVKVDAANAEATRQRKEREEAEAEAALAASPEVAIPQVVLDALLDVYYSDREGMGDEKSYRIVWAWDKGESR